MPLSSALYLYLADFVAQTKPTGDQVETGFVYVIAAFTVVWLFIAGYLFWLNRRQNSLQQEVEMLRREEAERQQNLNPANQENAVSQPTSSIGGPPLG